VWRRKYLNKSHFQLTSSLGVLHPSRYLTLQSLMITCLNTMMIRDQLPSGRHSVGERGLKYCKHRILCTLVYIWSNILGFVSV